LSLMIPPGHCGPPVAIELDSRILLLHDALCPGSIPRGKLSGYRWDPSSRHQLVAAENAVRDMRLIYEFVLRRVLPLIVLALRPSREM
jgi:hypothetical protein